MVLIDLALLEEVTFYLFFFFLLLVIFLFNYLNCVAVFLGVVAGNTISDYFIILIVLLIIRSCRASIIELTRIAVLCCVLIQPMKLLQIFSHSVLMLAFLGSMRMLSGDYLL